MQLPPLISSPFLSHTLPSHVYMCHFLLHISETPSSDAHQLLSYLAYCYLLLAQFAFITYPIYLKSLCQDILVTQIRPRQLCLPTHL